MIAAYGSAVAVCAAAMAIGRGVFALSGERTWTWLAPGVGYAALLAVCGTTIRLPGHAWTAFAVVLVLGAASLWVRGRRWGERWWGKRMALDGLVVGFALLGATAVPFVATDRVGLLGVSFDNDASFHLLLAAGLQHPELRHYTNYGPGYPVGPHSVVATVAQGLGVSLASALTGLLIATVVITGLTALAALGELRRPQRWLVAIFVATPYLAASWYAEGAFKEPLMGMLLLTFVLVLRHGRRESFRNPWPVAVPAAVVPVGIVYAYSYAGLAWPAVFLMLWTAAELGLRLLRPARRQLLGDLRVRMWALAAAVVVCVVGVAPDLGRIRTFLASQGGAGLGTVAGIPKANLGNLAGPLSAREGLGVWLRGDFRFWPADVHQARMLSLFALGILLLGVARDLIRLDLALPAALAGCAALYLYTRHTQSPYVAAKALVVPAPLIALVVGRGLFRSVDVRPWGRPMTVALALLAVPFLCLAFGSSYLALRSAQVGPSEHARELRGLVRLLHGRPTLALFHDDFYQYELLPAPASSPAISSPILPAGFSAQKPWQYGQPIDFDSVDAATLDRFDYVITVRTPYQSGPPPNFRIVARTPSYELWRRLGPTRPRRVLPESGAPGAVLDCSRRSGRQIMRLHGVARTRRTPVVQRLGWGLGPGHSASTAITLPPGVSRLSFAYTSAFRLRVAAGTFHASLPANLDRPGAYWGVGDIVGTGRPRTITVTEDDPSPLSVGSDWANVIALAAVPTEPARTVPLSRACGKYVDWYRVGG